MDWEAYCFGTFLLWLTQTLINILVISSMCFLGTMAKPKTCLQLRTDCSFTQVVKICQKHGHKLLEMRVQLLGDRRNCQRYSRSLGGNLIWNVTWFSHGHRLEDSFGHWDHWSSSSHRTQTVQGNTHAYKQPSGLQTIRVGNFGVKFKLSVFLVWIKHFHQDPEL